MYNAMLMLFAQLKLQFASWRSKPFVWAGILLGVSMAFKPTLDLINLAQDRGAFINVLEPFVMIGSNEAYCLYVFLGILVMMSDAPFVDDMNIYTTLRVTRNTWFISKVIYIALSCVAFYGTILLGTVLMCANIGYAENVWSKTMLRLNEDIALSLEYGINASGIAVLRRFTPISAAAMTFVLQSAYGITMSLLIFILNMKYRKAVGVLTTLVVHGVGRWIIKENIMFNQLYTLLGRSMLGYHVLEQSLPNTLHGWITWCAEWFSFNCSRYPILDESLYIFAVLMVAEVTLGLRMVKNMNFTVPYREI